MVSWQEDVQAAPNELCRRLFEGHNYYQWLGRVA